MGSYSSLKLADYEIGTSKSYIDPYWACLFKETDKRSRQVHYGGYYEVPLDNDSELVPTTEYAVSAEAMKLRLEIMGFTLEKVKQNFEYHIAQVLKDRKDFYGEDKADDDDRNKLNHITTLKNNGFDGWLKAISHIMAQKLNIWDLPFDRNIEQDDLYSFMLTYDDIFEDLTLGYPHIGFGYLLRGLLETVSPNDELILDLTSLVYSGYYAEDESVCENAWQTQINATLEFQKIIILTEGTSDSQYLSRSLNVLYPEVARYFSFLDFDTLKPDGGSSALEKTVKSFAAAGVNNKLIALFDNDAAGMASVKRLGKKPLPANVRVLLLPELELGLKYPTLGPQGETEENINGRACSIEMYFGTDVLRTENGYTPISWRNLEPQINEYQGEIMYKDEVQKRFLKKLTLAEKKGLHLEDDWSGLRLIFEKVFCAASK